MKDEREFHQSELTDGEKKIVAALRKLAKLWREHGDDLLLFNGTDLRKGGTGAQYTIESFPGIRGDGGDGGDRF